MENVRMLVEEELWESVALVGSLLSEAAERGPEAAEAALELVVARSTAHFHLAQYREAEGLLKEALRLRKAAALPKSPRPADAKTRSRAAQAGRDAPPSETELKYRLYLCHWRQDKVQQAAGVLESIPVAKRSPKVQAALASVHLRTGRKKLATEYLRDLVAETPFALSELRRLRALAPAGPAAAPKKGPGFTAWWEGSKRMEALCGTAWLPLWAAGTEKLGRRDWEGALAALHQLDDQTELSGNAHVLAALGEAYAGRGQRGKAIEQLRRVGLGQGAELLGPLLFEEGQLGELESLSATALAEDATSPVSWLLLGYQCLGQGRKSEALSLAHKTVGTATQWPHLSPAAHLQGLLLKAKTLSAMENHSAAVMHFHEALALEPYRMEVYEGLAEALVAQKKPAEALRAAELALKGLAREPRALLLLAGLLAKDPSSTAQAVELAERAVERAPFLHSAVFFLAELYGVLGQNEAAVRLLSHHAKTSPSAKLHRILGDFYSRLGRAAEAVDAYRYALSLDPSDQAAAEGMEGATDDVSDSASLFADGPADDPTPASYAAFVPPPAPSKPRPSRHEPRCPPAPTRPPTSAAFPAHSTPAPFLLPSADDHDSLDTP